MLQGSPPQPVLPAGLSWAGHMLKERPRVSCRNISFRDFAQEPRLHFGLSKDIGGRLMASQKQVKSCPDYYILKVEWSASDS